MHVGIDYGSKMAGTTVICFDQNNQLHFHSSKKKQDADRMILDWVDTHSKVSKIHIDAPLSLPMVYRMPDINKPDFFYRACDQSIKAMSPMFLGGLTARAMRLKSQMLAGGIEMYEAYPGGLARHLQLDQLGYKKEKEQIPIVVKELLKLTDLTLSEEPKNWHMVDALLAWNVALRHANKQAIEHGVPEEGVILV